MGDQENKLRGPSEEFRTLTEVEAWDGWNAYDGNDESSDENSEECCEEGSVANCRTFDYDDEVDAEMQEVDND
jgi:hypothetical protein